MLKIIALALCSFLTLTAIGQTSITLDNPNFDQDILLEGGFTSTITGWTATSASGIFNPTETHYPTEDGSRENVGYTNNGSLIQVTDELLAANTLYTLNLEVGHRADSPQAPFTVRFVANGLVLAQVGGYTIDAGAWRSVQLNLSTSPAHPIGYPLEIHLISTNNQSHYDNISLSRGEASTPGGGGQGVPIITSNTTLNVPAQYADINAALDSLEGVLISTKAIVTIQVADGTYTNLDTIVVDHLNGKQIQILGNPGNAAAVSFSFTGEVDGFQINSSNLGLLDGFTLVGDNLKGYGIYANAGSHVTLGSAISVSNFEHGVYAFDNSSIFARGINASNNLGQGIMASNNANIDCQGATANNNSSNIAAINNSFIDASNTTTLNGFRGLNAWMNSTIFGSGATVQGNTIGVLSNDGCHIHIGGGAISGNATNYAPLVNTVGQSNSYIYKY